MKKHLINEITISIAFLFLVVLLFDPFMLYVPDSLVAMLIAGLVILFALFASFVWREKVLDEREQLHKMAAGRVGYLIGAGALLLGVSVQAFTSHPDPWLVFGLTAMVLGKLIGIFYSRKRF